MPASGRWPWPWLLQLRPDSSSRVPPTATEKAFSLAGTVAGSVKKSTITS